MRVCVFGKMAAYTAVTMEFDSLCLTLQPVVLYFHVVIVIVNANGAWTFSVVPEESLGKSWCVLLMH